MSNAKNKITGENNKNIRTDDEENCKVPSNSDSVLLLDFSSADQEKDEEVLQKTKENITDI